MHETSASLKLLTGSLSTPALGNPTVTIVEAAYAHYGIPARYINKPQPFPGNVVCTHCKQTTLTLHPGSGCSRTGCRWPRPRTVRRSGGLMWASSKR
jgi:hypothetical protein